MVPKATSHIFWQSVHAGAVAAGRDLHVEVLWNSPALETDFSRQIQIVDSMIAKHVDGLALSASDRTALNLRSTAPSSPASRSPSSIPESTPRTI